MEDFGADFALVGGFIAAVSSTLTNKYGGEKGYAQGASCRMYSET